MHYNPIISKSHPASSSKLSQLIKIISTIANIHSVTETMEDSTDYFLQYIILLSSETLKDDFFQLGRGVSYFTYLKKKTFMVQITKRWGKDIIEEGAMSVIKENGRVIT